MDMQPKTEHGSPQPVFTSSFSNHANLDDMSVPQLVSRMRTASRRDEFDSLEKVLVAKDAKLKDEVTSLQVKYEMERLNKLQAEEEMKKKDEECQKGKRAKELYQKLLKEVKESELVNMETIKELRDKNIGLLDENCKLKELITKLVDDSIALAKLRVKVSELEDESVEFEARKKNWEDGMLLTSVDASGSGGNVEWEEPKAEPQELSELNEMDVVAMNGPAFASDFGTNIIDIKDSDDDQTHPRQEENLSSRSSWNLEDGKLFEEPHYCCQMVLLYL
ncbi:hypothetical protein RIF29_18087 [Crotalaria pallida]|uniref:Uncharacterized protein n=1 Tax=Crotalaria pallida TaxID=3830 RepID=A0AAN9IDK9_CROPI